MKKGATGLILLVLVMLILFAIIFGTSKLILPNPQSIEVKKETSKQAEDAINKYQQRNVQGQSIDVK